MKFYTKRCYHNTQELPQQKQEGSLLDFRMFLSFTRHFLFLLPLASLFLLASCGDSSSSPTAGIDSGANLAIANSSANEGDASIYFRVTLRAAADSSVSFEYKTQGITANKDVAFSRSSSSSLGKISSHSSLVFDHNNNNNNNMWILGGHGAGGESNLVGRVWAFPNDDDKWSEVTANVGWDKRASHSSVVFENKMWVLGGKADNNPLTDASVRNDVWDSTNGINWNEVKADSTNDPHSWSARQEHTSVVFKNKMWVLGGSVVGDSLKNDVWSSTNGITWKKTEINDNNPRWEARRSHSSVEFKDEIWVLGGYAKRSPTDASFRNDVWSSVDGEVWKEVTDDANWSARQNHTSVVFEGKIWVLGGMIDNALKNDVWSSTNGRDWTNAGVSNRWKTRQNHSSVVFKDEIWVLGGDDGGSTGATNGVYSAFTTGDYTSTSDRRSIPPGATTTDIKITITNDSNREENETFELIISNPTNAVIDPARSKAIGTIQDND